MIPERETKQSELLVGIDVGSTTTKLVAADKDSKEILYSSYKRHNSSQVQSVQEALGRLREQFPEGTVRVAMTGSGAKPVAEALEVPFIQEVVANSVVLCEKYPNVRTAIELGGQDAKIIFFRKNQEDGSLTVSDMRMNGSCAGGTGAFIDEVASIVKVPIEQFNALAQRGTCVYDISGRCGVYAKTDIQPLLNQGIAKSDLALSAFHAIAKQTIGGLAQGLDIEKPVAFEGGPMTFNPVLIRVFAERLGLSKDEIIRPERPEIIIAYGAALSLNTMFQDKKQVYKIQELEERLGELKHKKGLSLGKKGKPFFASQKERREFEERHQLPQIKAPELKEGETLHAYLGIDSGSTTTKFVLMDEDENILDSFYAPNEGDPLLVAKKALIAMRDKYEKKGVKLDIIAAGTTGYGEVLFAKAFETECHVVETVAHARAARKYVEDATFILDIGGQDMKAIWLDNGIITNIVLNEACSSGCGSFLENFASSLHIPVEKIAQTAFDSQSPAELGSRCTVFMNSSIITEQRNGKLPGDIMAGLCRSIIENVFTKVIRVSNLDSLGDKIVVQGGTFQNDAVLRAMEQYLGKNVVRAPYPGIMGAIGAALITKERFSQKGQKTFIGLDAMDDFSYTQESNSPCPFCANHCKRTIIRFSNGNSWITNNRCERGEVLGDPKDKEVQAKIKEKRQALKEVPNLYILREELLMKKYPYPEPEVQRDITIGIPRVLSFWETMPFWRTFWKALGFKVKVSPASTRKMYEDGLSAVTSDTVCFPAKLVHGHIRSLAKLGVDRIFMPSITTVESENTEDTSQSMCAVVKGYPIVIRNSDNPKKRWNIPFDAPLFHWYTNGDRDRQLTKYMEDTFQISPELTRKAIAAGDEAQNSFHQELQKAGEEVCRQVQEKGTYAVVLASRPYQNDALVNHDLPDMFTKMGIPVLTADSLPGVEHGELKKSRLDVVNNYHARMLSSAILAAEKDYLEYVQIVSFGCGHDAYLSDEIIRLMKDISGKTPLILKLDESDIQGPLRIRIRSFTETVAMQRSSGKKLTVHELPDPYPVKYTKASRKEKVALIPNTSHAFSRVMAAAFAGQGIRTEPLELGREEAIRLGKQYVHNDICFPAQIVIGEALAALKSGKYDDKEVAIGMGKYVGDCRLTHYSALLRKALDDAGYSYVPILTNDDKDSHDLHPGFKMNLLTAVRIAFAMPMIDVLEELLRKTRPYEKVPGSADAAFEKALDQVVEGLEKHGVMGARKGFEKAIDIMNQVEYDRSHPRPTVLIVGEYLLNFHPGANHDIEAYLEKNGFEIIEARMTDVIRKTYFYQDAQIREYHLDKPVSQKVWLRTANAAFNAAHDVTDKIARKSPLYTPACRMQDLVKDSDPIIHHTFDAGEGVLIPGEIIHHAKHGCRAFVILQPFGCLPNHVVGRGIIKKLKEMYPDASILPLDYDPDVSFANIENRLQMLIMSFKNKREDS
ncbi:MAG TPA: 2-hydroxyacyl-CoA dehydratase [Candidatus Blautia stercoripullorum]|uniref:2-hydroxyacyl-CoA dehydratase n=1 Tax=Candidatus Blautia stercoripullorum TaxID=2838502 RepID=A0A9D2U4K2_9FIRM|nr:2-hydroxyacyl-CoA dehydratase [Candidatus Blautia stercoripullorum]